MQQHPVPQNITSFQFKLVGDMTLKQFGYLAGGIIAGILASKLPYPAIFNYTLAGTFAFSGFALAFLPIEDRPLDVWLKNFVISVFSPTQFIYQKTGGVLDFMNIDLTRGTQNASLVIEKNLKQDRFRDYLGTLSSPKKNPLDIAINSYLKTLDLDGKTPQLQTITPTNRQNNATLERPSMDVKIRPLTIPPINTSDSANQPTDKIIKTGPDEQFQQIHLSPASPTQTTTYVKNPYIAPKQEIKTQTINLDYLKSSLPDKVKQIDETKQKTEEAARNQKELVKQKLQEAAKRNILDKSPVNEHDKTTIDVSSIKKIYQTPQTPKTPNIICGTIVDASDAPIPGAIVEIKNSAWIAERTMRTNMIGQFATITPLPLGTYTIFIEKPGASFDNIKILLDNKIVEPLLIKAK